ANSSSVGRNTGHSGGDVNSNSFHLSMSMLQTGAASTVSEVAVDSSPLRPFWSGESSPPDDGADWVAILDSAGALDTFIGGGGGRRRRWNAPGLARRPKEPSDQQNTLTLS